MAHYEVEFFFFREFQPIALASNDNSYYHGFRPRLFKEPENGEI